MKPLSIKTAWFKFAIAWAVIFLVRLIPFRPPNIEPILATVMPFSKRYGLLGSFVFSFLSIVLYDMLTSGIGLWTIATAAAYGLLGIGSYFFFKNREASIKNFLIFGVVGTIFYDAATGLTVAPLFFHQTLYQAIVGQIPFTLLHLAGTITFSIFLSPLLYRWVVQNDVLEFNLIPSPALAPVK
jgi:hypothetical protein